MKDDRREPEKKKKTDPAKKQPPLKDDKEPRSTLFPGMKIPKDIEKLAVKMKTAELRRKEAGAIEKEARQYLCAIMQQQKCKAFQIEIDDQVFEFKLEEGEAKVTSKRMAEDE